MLPDDHEASYNHRDGRHHCWCITLIVSILFLLIWLPYYLLLSDPKFYVDNVTLTQFTYSSANKTLYYNLAVNMTFRNPSRHTGCNYHKIKAHAVYHDHRFATTEIQGFYLGHKSENNNVNIVFKGHEHLMELIWGDDSAYSRENKAGVYEIDLYLKFRMRYKLFLEIPERYKVRCRLKVPLISSSVKFKRTKCRFHSDIGMHPHLGYYY